MKILVIHGANLNMLGKRNKQHYGSSTLEDLYQHILNRFPDMHFDFYQSNYEGEIIDVIHQAYEHPYDAILINAGAFTHQSIAIRDALEMIRFIKIEVHLSDLSKREAFRQINYIQDVCEKSFMGKQLESYVEALSYIEEKVKSNQI